ncbi:hypothetical protein RB595_004106 [Gaeumannomyces hyphopodioides]
MPSTPTKSPPGGAFTPPSSPPSKQGTPGSLGGLTTFSSNFTFTANLNNLASNVSHLSLSPQHHPLSPSPANSLPSSASPLPDPVPYDIRDEGAPLHQFFDPSFQNALRGAVDIAKELVNLIGDLRGTEPPYYNALTRLLKDARRLGDFTGSETRTIAVLGDSGQGKSSLINSLLHYPDVAQTGDIGSACTSVVTEYRQKTNQQSAPIMLEVEYLSGSEIEDMIGELLWSYRQLYLPDVASDTTPAADYTRYMRESEQAWSALEAAFQHQPGFSREMLQDLSDGSLERLRNRLVGWARDIEWPRGDDEAQDGIWRSTAATGEECCKKASLFMQNSYWPFTKVIRVYIDAEVLKTGLVLADLPGLQDTNLARVRATEDYLMKCNNIFIVANISRAITDQSLKSSLYSVLSRHVPMAWDEVAGKGLKVAVVCTKSDDINLNAAKGAFCGPGKAIDPVTLQNLDAGIEVAKRSGSQHYYLKTLKHRKKILFIKARSDHVKRGLQQAYASKVPGEVLDVFCVSNTMYEKYAPQGNGELVAASEIPDVRRFCHSVTAEARYNEACHFMHSSMPSLLSTLKLWINSYTTRAAETNAQDEELNDKICDALRDATAQITTGVIELSGTFRVCFRDQILKLSEGWRPQWEKKAAEEGSKWQVWHWTQYNAWCLNNGHHATRKMSRQDWNAQILWKMRMELDYAWGIVEDEANEVFDAFLKAATTQLGGLRDKVKEPQLRRSLAEGLDCHIEDLEYRIGRCKEDFLHQVKTIRRHASESNHNSYVLREMLPAYRHACSQSGDGKGQRQQDIIQGRITDGELFPNICAAISTAMEQLVRNTERKLHADAMTVVRQIENDFDIAFKRLATDGDEGSDSDDDGEQGGGGGGGLDLAEVARFAERVEDCQQRVSNLAKMAVTST